MTAMNVSSSVSVRSSPRTFDREKGNSVYRQAVENYDVANYYTQGNVTATSVEDANGNKYTETKYMQPIQMLNSIASDSSIKLLLLIFSGFFLETR